MLCGLGHGLDASVALGVGKEFLGNGTPAVQQHVIVIHRLGGVLEHIACILENVLMYVLLDGGNVGSLVLDLRRSLL